MPSQKNSVKTLDLFWHGYRYYPYERVLAEREARALLAPQGIEEVGSALRLHGVKQEHLAAHLVYFDSYGANGERTWQAILEGGSGNRTNRQATRYSAHGLHEYKGKFNPQVAKAVLNIYVGREGANVLDPFCGSGTSLVEASLLGMHAVGTDLNPLAVFIANAKLASLGMNLDAARKALTRTLRRTVRRKDQADDFSERNRYLMAWFTPEVLRDIEALRDAILVEDVSIRSVLLACASDLLRAYSLQDPMDLRIRRRKSALPEKPFKDAFAEKMRRYLDRIEHGQTARAKNGSGVACLSDCRSINRGIAGGRKLFDAVLTSPPYATALPYIDTQRLSLVWLGAIEPDQILRLEAELLGSREARGADRKEMIAALKGNAANLPSSQYDYCSELAINVGKDDGFRRQAVPHLLYRYFSGMRDSFRSIRGVVRKRAPYVLIVGGNHTVLNGRRYDIDTPRHLSELAETAGWRTKEMLQLQTYKRFGIHAANSVTSESMVVLEAK